ncbi:Protein FAR1-RELATED SEQUENCE 5 [Abeliophyllum distichum]|uniref:Protein FAR1-RELATED SEQUENCE n=1 Tax=Abeliophyllum distichum TaxID=126358 RepID=A0ABD1RBV2_9LAMI
MSDTGLHCHEWLQTMYDIRSRWVPAYVKHIFSVGMSSSQRSESGHSFLKKYVNRKNSLMGFITRFNRALSHQRHDELVANHVDLNEQPRVTSSVMMESQMVKIYTKKVFMLFQNEVVKSNLYICSKKETFSHMKTYVVQRLEHGPNFDRPRELQYYTDTDFVACSCRTFDFEGYPCRHMICFLKKKQVLLLPEKYILRRWTKNAKIGSVCESNATNYRDDSSIQSLMGRHGMLSQKAQVLVDDAALTHARSTFLLGEFEMLNLRVKEIDDGGNFGKIKSKSSSQSREVQQVIEDPTGVRAKGCGKRLRSSKEKAMARGIRQCSVCGVNGHDKRTCPRLNDRSNVGDCSETQYDYDDPQDDRRDDATFTSITSSNFHFGEYRRGFDSERMAMEENTAHGKQRLKYRARRTQVASL